MTLGKSEEFSAQTSWPFILHFSVAKLLCFYCLYVGGLLPQIDLKKKNLKQCLETVYLVSFERGKCDGYREGRGDQAIFWQGGGLAQFLF